MFRNVTRLIICLIILIGLSGCQIIPGDEPKVEEQYEIFLLAKKSGYIGTYEEWLESIKGEKGDKGDKGEDGHTPVITIVDGYWYVDGVNTFVLAEGKNGVDGNGIKSIKLTISKDDEDIYTIYFTNGEETTFSISKQNTSSNTTIKHLELLEKKDGYVLPSTSVGKEVLFGSFSTHSKYLLPAYVNVTIIMKTGGSYGFARTDKSNIIIESCSNGNYGYYTFKALDYDTYLYVSDVKVSEIKECNSLKDGSSYWSGKNIWWCGTSIPAGGYPLLVGEKLGANVYQEAVGGSMLRANVSTGDYNGANISNITSSLSMTLDEANSFIENYDNLRLLDNNGSWPEVLSESYKKRILSGTFETKLLPYLTSQKPMPDLFVIDHGHNDWKYRDQNGSVDIELEPTVENIKNGLLKEDTYMTMNNYENLKKYFGDLSNIPEDKFDDFVASINRNCYKGAMNFILTLILSHNPHARVVFISNYEYKNGINPGYANVIDAQVSLANEWCFPIFEIYKYLGYSDKIIPGTKDYMNENYPNQNFDEDVSVYEIYNVDKVHPSSDTTGFANDIYAELIAQFLENVR